MAGLVQSAADGCLLGVAIVLLLIAEIAHAQPPGTPPVEAGLHVAPQEPAAAQNAFRVQAGFRLDLLAAEPLVTDPIAMAYDEQGRAYVAEMNDYPYVDKTSDRSFSENTTDPPLGRIRLLEDSDADGDFDRATVFAEELSWPTGLALWKGGIYVVATPDLWYLKDTDGDGRADVRRKIVTGFRKFNIQAVVNNLAWGPDHRIYGAGGTNGGQLATGAAGGAAPLAMRVNDFRLDPTTERVELLTGGARFGNTFDDSGSRFICNIRNPVQHVVLSAEYLARNPLLSVSTALHDAAQFGEAIPVYRASAPEPWRVLNAARLASDPKSFSPRSETVSAGYMTSACGITVYRGGAYPAEYYGQVFLAEPAANLIHRQILNREGVTYRAERADRDVEFATSTDNWFRPVNFVNAPDGTLHVLDMYRETIEHPWSIPDDIKARLDLRSGADRGRIYRLTPPDFKVPPPPRLGEASTLQLVEHLASPNSWWGETAQRLIFERQDNSVVLRLRELLRDVTKRADKLSRPDAAALGRLRALWSLAGLEALEPADLQAALTDPSAEVRTAAIRLSEPYLAASDSLCDAVASLADDPEMWVRFQAALSLGGVDRPQAVAARARIALGDAADRWMRIAVLAAPPDSLSALAELILSAPRDREDSSRLPLVREIAQTIGAKNDARANQQLLALVIRESIAADQQLVREALLGLGAGLTPHGKRLADVIQATADVDRRFANLAASAQATAGDSATTLVDRRQAVELLGQLDPDALRPIAPALLATSEPTELQVTTLRVLGQGRGVEIPTLVAAAYRGLSPAVRREAIQVLLSRPNWTAEVLHAVTSGQIPAADIPRSRRAPLLRHTDPKVRDTAVAIFQRDVLSPRADVVARFRECLDLPSDAIQGKQVFARCCRTCHRLGDDGTDVGPSLSTVRHRTKNELMLSILDPNREVTAEFVEYVAALRDGRVVSGAIGAETPTSLTLRRAEGATETVLRQDIESMSSSGKSIMPEGFEKQLSLQDMANLLAYLSAGR